MSIGFARVVVGLSLALFAGCAGNVQPPQPDAAETDRTELLVSPTTLPTPSHTPVLPTPEPHAKPSGLNDQIAYVEQLPALADLAQPAPRPNLGLRATAWREVAVIQMALNAVTAADLDIDGRFGPATDTAVRAFQSSRGTDIDGYVGPDTLRELVDALSELGGAVPPPTYIPTSPPTPSYYGLSGGTVCNDGWISSSSGGSGTCSWHDGIQ